MSGLYVKLDCEFDSDDKVLDCSGQAQLVYVKSLLLSKRRMSDGLIHSKHLRLLADAFTDGDENRAVWAQELVDAGLWTVVPEGWLIAAWTKHNKTSTEIEDDKAAEAERKRIWRDRKNKRDEASENVPTGQNVRDGQPEPEGEGKPEGEPEPFSLASVLNSRLGITSTKRAKEAREAAVAELKAVGATAAQVNARIDAYKLRWPSATCTDNALVKHWDSLVPVRSVPDAIVKRELPPEIQATLDAEEAKALA